jgi:hypothetical protein
MIIVCLSTIFVVDALMLQTIRRKRVNGKEWCHVTFKAHRRIEQNEPRTTTMTKMMRSLLLSCLLLGSTTAFVATNNNNNANTRLYSAVGGWGIGQSRELTDGEKAKGERRAFDGYELRERGDFLQSIKEERAQMAKDEMDELLGVAKMAGIDVKPSTKFGDDLFEDEEEDLDVSVQWEEEDESDVDQESITRMDEDTGAPGVW